LAHDGRGRLGGQDDVLYTLDYDRALADPSELDNTIGEWLKRNNLGKDTLTLTTADHG